MRNHVHYKCKKRQQTANGQAQNHENGDVDVDEDEIEDIDRKIMEKRKAAEEKQRKSRVKEEDEEGKRKEVSTGNVNCFKSPIILIQMFLTSLKTLYPNHAYAMDVRKKEFGYKTYYKKTILRKTKS